MVNFDPVKHVYTSAETGERYNSVSQLLSIYKEPFDSKKWATKVALREKVSVQTILDRWEKNKNDACDRGKNIHSIIEDYIKTVKITDENVINEFRKTFNRDDYKKIHSEIILCSHTHKIAGTSDCIADVNELFFDVIDYKTNKSFSYHNKYGEYLKAPVNHLQHCHYNDYALQLSLYAYLYMKKTGKKLRKIEVYYWDGKFTVVPMPFMFWEIEILLKHYGSINLK